MITIGGERVLAIDSDAHVIESEATWSYLDAADEKYRPILVGSEHDPSHQYWLLQDKVIGFRFPSLTSRELDELSRNTGRDMRTASEARDLSQVDLRLQHMDQVGIDIQVLHNTLWIRQVTDREGAELALCRSYNRWLADVWERGKGRLRWACLPPTLRIPDAVEEIRWCKEHGAAGVCLRPIEGDHHLSDEYFYPLYEECERLDLPITVHIANGNPANVDLVRHSLFWQFRVPTVAACHTYLRSEVSQVFPKLRVGFIEAGSVWLPWIIEGVGRLASGKPDRAHYAEILKEHNVWVTCEYEDDLPYITRYSGEDTLIIGTDYGHTDPFSNVRALNEFAARTDVSDRLKRKILDDNARAFYAIPDEDLPEAVRPTLSTGALSTGPRA